MGHSIVGGTCCCPNSIDGGVPEAFQDQRRVPEVPEAVRDQNKGYVAWGQRTSLGVTRGILWWTRRVRVCAGGVNRVDEGRAALGRWTNSERKRLATRAYFTACQEKSWGCWGLGGTGAVPEAVRDQNRS